MRIQIAVEVRNAVAALETAAPAHRGGPRRARRRRDPAAGGSRIASAPALTTPFLVLTRQNDLAAAEVADAAATAAYRRALAELARARGTLLRDRADRGR